MKSMAACAVKREELTVADREAMIKLMQASYAGVTASEFDRDLAAKQWVVVVREVNDLVGFSTLTLSEHEVDGRKARVAFSGDTIIEPRCWGSMALPICWGTKLVELLGAAESPLYWLLTSKGYKTYRYLPVFFRHFYPNYRESIPRFENALLNHLSRRWNGRYDAERGVLRATADGQRLRPGVAEINPRRRRDPDIAYFEQCNPRHMAGDELVCLAHFARENLRPAIWRRISGVAC
jgi:hypothetical protein